MLMYISGINRVVISTPFFIGKTNDPFLWATTIYPDGFFYVGFQLHPKREQRRSLWCLDRRYALLNGAEQRCSCAFPLTINGVNRMLFTKRPVFINVMDVVESTDRLISKYQNNPHFRAFCDGITIRSNLIEQEDLVECISTFCDVISDLQKQLVVAKQNAQPSNITV